MPPRSALGASPPGGRHQWPGKAGFTVALENAARFAAAIFRSVENQNG